MHQAEALRLAAEAAKADGPPSKRTRTGGAMYDKSNYVDNSGKRKKKSKAIAPEDGFELDLVDLPAAAAEYGTAKPTAGREISMQDLLARRDTDEPWPLRYETNCANAWASRRRLENGDFKNVPLLEAALLAVYELSDLGPACNPRLKVYASDHERVVKGKFTGVLGGYSPSHTDNKASTDSVRSRAPSALLRLSLHGTLHPSLSRPPPSLAPLRATVSAAFASRARLTRASRRPSTCC